MTLASSIRRHFLLPRRVVLLQHGHFLSFWPYDMMLHRRRQHTVGQGGFHTGTIILPTYDGPMVLPDGFPDALGASSFKYVYDCGSRQRLCCEDASRRFVSRSGSKRLDLLLLSHFDDDHINGVPALIDRATGLKVGTVVMPWVDDVDRMILYARSIVRDRARAVSDRTSEFFKELAIDLVGRMSEFQPERIVLIRSEPDADAGPFEPEPPEPTGGSPFRLELLSYDSNRTFSRAQGSHQSVSGVEVATANPDTVLRVSTQPLQMCWLFKPYVRRVDQRYITKFEKEAEIKLGWSTGSFRNQASQRAVREKLVRCPAQSGKLADAYKAAFRDRNLTTLSLYSGPLSESSPPRQMVEMQKKRCRPTNKIGWLGTGDAPLATQAASNDFLRHFDTETDLVKTYALPHHGAKANHSKTIIDQIRPAICYASANPPKNWRHPHPNVMIDVKLCGAHPIHVSCRRSTALEETFAIWF